MASRRADRGAARRPRPGLVLVLVLVLVACSSSSPPSPPASPVAAPGPLTARLTAAGDVELAWPRGGGAAPLAWAWVELATPGSDFVTLAALSPEVTTFVHPRLAPDTTFLFRVRPSVGVASAPITVTTGPASVADEHADDGGPAGPIDEPAGAAGHATSLRSLATIAAAAPTALTATRSAATTVELRWIDHASDEDGYLVEVAVAGGPYDVSALLPADTTSFRAVALPPATTLAFRVRAFVRGPSSALASVTIGPELERAP